MITTWEFRWILLGLGMLLLFLIYIWSKKHRDETSVNIEDDEGLLDEQFKVSINPSLEKLDIGTVNLRGSLTRDDTEPLDEAGVKIPTNRNKSSIAETKKVADVANEKERTEGQPSRHVSREEAKKTVTFIEDFQQRKEKIITLQAVVGQNQYIGGADLISGLRAAGLEYGEMQIFHHYIERLGGKYTLFSVANMVKPGTLDPQHADQINTPGVSLFLRLPGPIEGLKAFNTMLDCADKLSKRFHGQVLDSARKPLTRHTVDRMREEIQLFSLRQS